MKHRQSTPLVRVVIVNFNTGIHLARCIAALYQQSMDDFEVVIVDNGSSDGSLERVGTLDKRFHVIRNTHNEGFAAACNRGAAAAETEWIATLNPDAVPSHDWLQNLLGATTRHPDAAVFGSTQVMADDPHVLDGAGDFLCVFGLPWRAYRGRSITELPDEGEVFSACAAAALYRAAAFRAAGGFDSDFFCYCEDVDLGFRLRLLGVRCIQVPSAVVAHVGGVSSGTNRELSAFYGARNRIWLLFKNMPSVLLWPVVSVVPLIHAALVLRAFARGAGQATMRGTIEGYAEVVHILPKRRAIQRTREVGMGPLFRAFVWNPWKILSRLA